MCPCHALRAAGAPDGVKEQKKWVDLIYVFKDAPVCCIKLIMLYLNVPLPIKKRCKSHSRRNVQVAFGNFPIFLQVVFRVIRNLLDSKVKCVVFYGWKDVVFWPGTVVFWPGISPVIVSFRSKGSFLSKGSYHFLCQQQILH